MIMMLGRLAHPCWIRKKGGKGGGEYVMFVFFLLQVNASLENLSLQYVIS